MPARGSDPDDRGREPARGVHPSPGVRGEHRRDPLRKDHPNRVDDFWNTQGHGVKIGAITNHAVTRLEGFKGIYDELSKFAHPQAAGLLASSSISEDFKLSWRSAPHFQKPEDQITAYAWVVELAEATRHLLYEFAQRYELGYFAQPSDDLDARDGL